jgi:hypothetical protein
MRALAVALVVVCAAVAGARVGASVDHSAVIPWDVLRARLMQGVDDSTPRSFLQGLLSNVVAALPNSLKQARSKPNAAPANYFGFIPNYEARAIPGSAALGVEGTVGNWSAPCFQQNTISASMDADGNGATLVINPSDPSSLLCEDFYLIGTVEGIALKSISTLTPKPVQIAWPFKAGVTPSEMVRWRPDRCVGVRL